MFDYVFLQNGQNLITLAFIQTNRFPRRLQKKHVRAVVSLVLKSGREKMNVHDVNGAHGVVVSHPLSMREALGSIPSVSIFLIVTGFILFSRPS